MCLSVFSDLFLSIWPFFYKEDAELCTVLCSSLRLEYIYLKKETCQFGSIFWPHAQIKTYCIPPGRKKLKLVSYCAYQWHSNVFYSGKSQFQTEVNGTWVCCLGQPRHLIEIHDIQNFRKKKFSSFLGIWSVIFQYRKLKERI